MTGIQLGWKRDVRDRYVNQEWKNGVVYRDKIRGDGASPYYYNDDGHLVTFAPTGSGKGVSCVIPTLLEYPGSVIVLDPKGENFAVTSHYRSSKLGQRIYAIDPYRVAGDWNSELFEMTYTTVNPFDLLGDERDSAGARARVMADALIPVESMVGEDRFWAVAAQNLLAGLIAHIIEDDRVARDKKNLVHVAEIVAEDVVDFVLKALGDDEEASESGGRPRLSSFTSKAFGNFVNIGSADKARDSVIFVLNTYIENLLTEEISNVLMSTSLNLEELRTLRHPYSLYLIVPPERLQSDANVLRLLITSILKVIIGRRKNRELKELIILDECAQLGRMNELRQVITLLRGYGVLAWMLFQDLSQLQTTYPDWKSIINNCGVVQVFGYDRRQPAEEVSNLLGTISVDDVMRLGRSRQIVSVRGDRARAIVKLNYLTDECYRGRFLDNPYHR